LPFAFPVAHEAPIEATWREPQGQFEAPVPLDAIPSGLRSVPLPAALAGAAGLLPVAGLVAAGLLGFEPFGRHPSAVLALYGAVILSFMGAIHWGLAMRAEPGEATWSYIASVIPALFGWFALAFLPQPVALRLLAFAFALLLLYDLRAARLGIVPAWYPRLRWPLTIVMVPSLLIASTLG
jgi:Protein of unknown function (DUF3429)